MKKIVTIAGAVAWLAMSVATSYANSVGGQVLCASDNTPLGGVKLVLTPGDCSTLFPPGGVELTDANGNYIYYLDDCVGPFTVCLDKTTLPLGATVIGSDCVTVTGDISQTFNFSINCHPSAPIPISVVVACPGGNAADGVTVNLFDCANNSIGSGVTGDGGVHGLTVVDISVPTCANGTFPFNVTVCVDTTTLPPGATLVPNCQTVPVPSDLGTSVTFDLSGAFCTPPTVTACWETGGGTLDKVKGDVVWTFGGVIYPGCSPTAAGGGNLNIVNHVTGLHFKGTDFVVDDCRGVSTKSPKVSVNIIDWHGTGYVSNADGSKRKSVVFVGTFRDAKESGANADGLYIRVVDLSGNVVFQIGGSPDDLDLLATGNVQIHQSSCGK